MGSKTFYRGFFFFASLHYSLLERVCVRLGIRTLPLPSTFPLQRRPSVRLHLANSLEWRLSASGTGGSAHSSGDYLQVMSTSSVLRVGMHVAVSVNHWLFLRTAHQCSSYTNTGPVTCTHVNNTTLHSDLPI